MNISILLWNSGPVFRYSAFSCFLFSDSAQAQSSYPEIYDNPILSGRHPLILIIPIIMAVLQYI